MPTLNYTTKVPVGKTVGECQSILARAKNVSAVMVRYQEGEPCGLNFALITPNGEQGFTLPVNIDGVAQLLRKQGKPAGGMSQAFFLSREHAARVAWRVVKDWLEAQLAIVDAQMVTIDQVMLPYLTAPDGRTLYELFRDRQLALPAGDR